MLVPEETYITTTKFWQPWDTVFENISIVGFQHPFRSSMLLLEQLLADIPW